MVDVIKRTYVVSQELEILHFETPIWNFILREITGVKTVEDFMPQIMLRAMAFANGVAMSLSAKNYSCVVDVRGEVKISGGAQTQECEIKIEKDYRLISSRRRGLYRDFSSGY